MKQDSMPLRSLCDLAIEAASAAGEFIQGIDRNTIQAQYKQAGLGAASQVVTEVDLHSEAIIRDYLEQSCIDWDIAFVGEETSPSAGEEVAGRLTKAHFWCVDPLDGTLPFVEGRPGYAVSIALVTQSGLPLIGVVYDPAAGTLIHAVSGQGACKNRLAIAVPHDTSRHLKVFVDNSFMTQDNREAIIEVLEACAHQSGLHGVEMVHGNGAVKNACGVLDYAAACYVKLPKPEQGGGSIWDFAATACILREAGAWASNIHGEILDLNRRDSTFMNHQGVLFASNEEIARSLVGQFSRFCRENAGK